QLPGALHVVGCAAASKEALVAKVPIEGVADLEGIKIRSPSGLAATVFQKAGAAPVSMSLSDVFTSLEKGVIDAADASAYINNSTSGFHQIATYPLYPGIHSMAVRQLTINKGVWDSMTPAQQEVLEVWFYATYDDVRRQLDLQDRAQVSADTAAGEITVIDWPQAERDKFRAIATEAWEETADKSPAARAALDAHYGYMKAIGLLK
ncbi:MAG: TRAP transporter substrate-binding protein DctP, partial [Pseudomonadota bacterium]